MSIREKIFVVTSETYLSLQPCGLHTCTFQGTATKITNGLSLECVLLYSTIIKSSRYKFLRMGHFKIKF